jgi:hypothetical protein
MVQIAAAVKANLLFCISRSLLPMYAFAFSRKARAASLLDPFNSDNNLPDERMVFFAQYSLQLTD